MSVLVLLVLVSVALGLGGLAAFVWALRNGQYDDLEGGAHRILEDDAGPAASGRPSGRRARKKHTPGYAGAQEEVSADDPAR